MRRTAAAVALAGATALAGCGGGASTPPGEAGARATVQRYFAAVAAGRPAAACAELTDRSQERLAEVAERLHAHGDGCTATMRTVLTSLYGRRLARLAHPRITALTVRGRRASARVDGVDRPLLLVDDGDAWRIDFTPSVEPD